MVCTKNTRERYINQLWKHLFAYLKRVLTRKKLLETLLIK